MENITLDIVREYKRFIDKFLGKIIANIYNIRFRKFRE